MSKPTKKALPPDVDDFLNGASVFFPPSPTEDSQDTEVKSGPPKETTSSEDDGIDAKNVIVQKSPSTPRSTEKVIHNKTVSSSEPNERTDKPNGQSERSSIILELAGEIKEAEQRKTERYSFEIYTDQIGTMEDLQYRYKKRTGKRLSSSRIIREALDEYMKKAEKTI